MQSLVDTEALRRGQQENPFSERVRSHLLHGEVNMDPEEKIDGKSYFLDDGELLWHSAAAKGKPVLAIHRRLVSDLISLAYATHDHPSVTSTLALLRVRFHWPTITRNVREYVLSCGCRSRRHSTNQRIAMLSVHATQSWEVLEIDFVCV